MRSNGVDGDMLVNDGLDQCLDAITFTSDMHKNAIRRKLERALSDARPQSALRSRRRSKWTSQDVADFVQNMGDAYTPCVFALCQVLSIEITPAK